MIQIQWNSAAAGGLGIDVRVSDDHWIYSYVYNISSGPTGFGQSVVDLHLAKNNCSYMCAVIAPGCFWVKKG